MNRVQCDRLLDRRASRDEFEVSLRCPGKGKRLTPETGQNRSRRRDDRYTTTLLNEDILVCLLGGMVPMPGWDCDPPSTDPIDLRGPRTDKRPGYIGSAGFSLKMLV